VSPEEEEEEAAAAAGAGYASLMLAYMAAVPRAALIPFENTWHVKMFQAVAAQDSKLSAGEGQLICKEDASLTHIYIYVAH